MPARFKKKVTTSADIRKRAYSRASYQEKKGNIKEAQRIRKEIEKANKLKTEKGRKAAYERINEKYSAKGEKVRKAEREAKQKEALKKAKATIKKERSKKEAEYMTNLIEKYNKVFGNEFIYEVADSTSGIAGVGEAMTNRVVELIKSQRSKYSDDEKIEFMKAYFDYRTNRQKAAMDLGIKRTEKLPDFDALFVQWFDKLKGKATEDTIEVDETPKEEKKPKKKERKTKRKGKK